MSNSASIPQTGYAAVNGLRLYYESTGNGQPLILIHGGFGMTGMFAQLIPALATKRRVIAIELQAHGHTADVDRPFAYEQFGDDIAALISDLGLSQADVMGYSLGGGAAWQTAIRHPEAVRKLITVSAPIKRVAWFPEVLAGMGAINPDGMMQTPMYDAYAAVAPDPKGFIALARKTQQLLAQPYDWSSQVAGLTMPVMIVAADSDSFAPAHVAEVYALLGGGKMDAGWDGANAARSRLAILPGCTHYNVAASPLVPEIVHAFLDAA